MSHRLNPLSKAADDRQVDLAAEEGRTYAVTLYEDLSALSGRFERLFSRAGRTSLYCTLPWYRNLIQSVLAPDERLRIYTVDTTASPRVASAALIMRYRDPGASWFGARTLSGMSNYYTSLFGPVIEPGESDSQQILDTLVAGIASDEIRWDVIDLHPLAVDAPIFKGLITAFRNAGMLVHTYFCFGNWHLQVNNQTFSEYFAARPSRLSKTGKRQRRVLEASGRFRFELFSGSDGLERAIADYNAVYNASWKGHEPYPNFISGLIRTCAEQGWLRLGIAYLDGQPAAAQLWTVVEGTASIYKMAYDERFAKYSVGTVLSSLLMEHVIDVDKVEVVDYLTGDDSYKRDWMSHRRERWGIVAFNLRTPHGLLAASRHLVGRGARRALDVVRHLRATFHANFDRSAAVLKARHILRRRTTAASASVALPSPAIVPTAATAVPASPAVAPAPRVARKWRLVPASEFSSHTQAWHSILSALPYVPVLDPIFIQAVVNVFGSGNEFLAICDDGPSPAAVALVHKTGTLAWQTMQPSQAPLGLWLHRPDLTWEELLPELMAQLPGMPLVLGVLQKNVEKFPRPKGRGHVRALDFALTARIRTDRPHDDYWKTRDGSVRRQIERRLRRLREGGIVPRLEVITDPAAMHAAVAEFGRMESTGWKGALGTAVHIDNIQGRFYSEVLRKFGERGNATVCRYLFNDTAVAMELCIDGGGVWVMLKTTYDQTYKKYAPGILMRHAIFERVFADNRIQRIEFLGKLQPWQFNWADEVYPLYHVNCYRWYWLAEMADVLNALRRRPGPAPQLDDGEQLERADGARHTHTVTKYVDLSALPVRYERLLSHAGKTSLFYTLPWYRNFIQSVLAANDYLRIYAVDTAAKQPAARALLMMLHRKRATGLFGARTLSGLSNYYTSMFGPVIEPRGLDVQDTLDALAAAIAEDEIRWDVIDLHPLADDSPVFVGLLAALRNAGLLTQPYFCFGNWYLQVRGRSYAEYFETLPSQLKSTILRKRNQFEKSANSRIVIYRDEAGLDEALRAYEQIYAASWKVPEPYPEFIPGLCRTCAETGWLRLGVAYIDDQPAAAQLWIVNDGTANIYKLAYDERFARFSLGTILTAHLMEHVIDVDKVDVVDYLTGDDAYKRDWMSDRRERWGIVAFNLRTPRGVLAALWHLGGRAVKHTIRTVRRLRVTRS